jgi:similar to spore coat protein
MMNAIIEAVTGMNKLSDQVIAIDFLVSAKSAVRNYAIALTETTSKEVREVLKMQLREAIKTHEAITNYMMKNGFYHAYNLQEQYKLDTKTAETALKLKEGFFK